MRLIGDFVSFFLSLPLHPLTVGEERDDAGRDNKNDTKDQHDTGVLAGPVAPLGKLVQVDGL